MDASVPEATMVIIPNDRKHNILFKMGRNVLVLFLTPIILLPIAFIGENSAYLSFYIFLVSTVFWITNVLHPSGTAMMSFASLMICSFFDSRLLNKFYIRSIVLEAFGSMCFIAVIEKSEVHKRIALKILLAFGCSHYRLSFLLFFATMASSMWCYGTTTCAYMIPIVKSILEELEKLGIVEMYESPNEQRNGKLVPSDLTTFYFIGIAYSSSIGTMATVIGSETNQIFKTYCDVMFPLGPRMEFPHFMLLTLPGVLILQAFLYFWMNFYFLGMFRVQNSLVVQNCMSDEECQYLQSLLSNEYEKLGKITFHEMIVTGVFLVNILNQALTSSVFFYENNEFVLKLTAPSIVAVSVLLILPTNLDFLKIFQRGGASEPFTISQYKTCLTWSMIKDIQWSVLFIIVSTDTIFEALKECQMTDEFEKFLLLFKGPTSVVAFIIKIVCKLLTECVSNSCLVYCIMPHIARVSVQLRINPHYLMSSAVLGSCLPFHLITSSPVNAFVSAYINIPQRKMIASGTGLSIAGVLVTWFTVTLWSRAVWHDITTYPEWANHQLFGK